MYKMNHSENRKLANITTLMKFDLLRISKAVFLQYMTFHMWPQYFFLSFFATEQAVLNLKHWKQLLHTNRTWNPKSCSSSFHILALSLTNKGHTIWHSQWHHNWHSRRGCEEVEQSFIRFQSQTNCQISFDHNIDPGLLVIEQVICGAIL